MADSYKCKHTLLGLEYFAQLNVFKAQPFRVSLFLRPMHIALLSIRSLVFLWSASTSPLCYQCYAEHWCTMIRLGLGFLFRSMKVVAGSVIILCFIFGELPDFSEVTTIFCSHQLCIIVLLPLRSRQLFLFFSNRNLNGHEISYIKFDLYFHMINNADHFLCIY